MDFVHWQPNPAHWYSCIKTVCAASSQGGKSGGFGRKMGFNSTSPFPPTSQWVSSDLCQRYPWCRFKERQRVEGCYWREQDPVCTIAARSTPFTDSPLHSASPPCPDLPFLTPDPPSHCSDPATHMGRPSCWHLASILQWSTLYGQFGAVTASGLVFCWWLAT